jgi:RimJ/RimL family protein N-acetyltransferase
MSLIREDKQLWKIMKNLVGKLVTLKPLQEEFFEEYHHMFSSTVRKILGLVPTCPLQETVNFLKALMVDKRELMFYCIFDNKTGKLIGAVNIRTVDHPNGQLGAWMNENFWGQGRYQEALYLILKEYFESSDEDSIFVFVDTSNLRSLKAHQKFGFVATEKSCEDNKYCPGKITHKLVLTRETFAVV